MPKTFTFTDPAGKLHKRTSQSRTYTHAVIYQRSYEGALHYATNLNLNNLRASYEHDRRVLATGVGNTYVSRRIGYRDMDITVTEHAFRSAAAEVEGIDTFEEYLASRTARAVAILGKKKAEGYFDEWCCAGYCGRLDLAEKLRSSLVGHHSDKINVRVVEVTCK